MCTYLYPDIIVSSLFRNKYEFCRFFRREEESLREKVTVTLQECLDEQVRCRMSMLGNVYAETDIRGFEYFFERYADFYKKVSANKYMLNFDFDTDDDIKNGLQATIRPGYPRYVLKAFGLNR